MFQACACGLLQEAVISYMSHFEMTKKKHWLGIILNQSGALANLVSIQFKKSFPIIFVHIMYVHINVSMVFTRSALLGPPEDGGLGGISALTLQEIQKYACFYSLSQHHVSNLQTSSRQSILSKLFYSSYSATALGQNRIWLR